MDEHPTACPGCSGCNTGTGCAGCTGCASAGGCPGCGASSREIALTRAQAELLALFAQTPFLPLCRFLLTSSREEDLESVALAPVILSELEKLGLISLDYALPLSGCTYEEYRTSPIFADLLAAVEEGVQQPGFLFDTAVLETGSMALTPLGAAVLEQLDGLL